MPNVYPLTIVRDRYTGCYSGGEFTAWNLHFDEVPIDIALDDITCGDFWREYEGPVGLGATPNEAVADLAEKLKKD